MKYKIGQRVRPNSDPSRPGMIEELGERHAGQQLYRDFCGKLGSRLVGEYDLSDYAATESASEGFRSELPRANAEHQRLLKIPRLLRENQLANKLCAFSASRTKLDAYKFKPSLRPLESAKRRILTCAEVCLGKASEPGCCFCK